MRKTILMTAAAGAVLAFAPGVAVAGSHHVMMKKKSHHAKASKGEPMEKAGTVGDKAAGGTNGATDSNTSGAGK